MATVQLHAMFQGVSGKSGGWVYKRRNGKVYLSKCPDFSRRKLSAEQKESVGHFRAAVQYAKQAIRNPQLRAAYEEQARAEGKSVFNTLVGEEMKRLKSLAAK